MNAVTRRLRLQNTLGRQTMDSNQKRELLFSTLSEERNSAEDHHPFHTTCYCHANPNFAFPTDLLTSDSRGLVRQCEDAGCGWLFLDRSNARKRRWCSMADCGNRNR